jgi:hypothetical protein
MSTKRSICVASLIAAKAISCDVVSCPEPGHVSRDRRPRSKAEPRDGGLTGVPNMSPNLNSRAASH